MSVNGDLAERAGGNLDVTAHPVASEGYASNGDGLDNPGDNPPPRETTTMPQSPRTSMEHMSPQQQVQAPARTDDTSTASTARPRNNPQKKGKKINKKTKAHLKIATLNMRGTGSTAPLDPNNKWAAINHLLRDRKIGILALQETHLTPQVADSLHSVYGRRMRIFSSADPDAPTRRAGVAIVLNKELTNIKDVKEYTIIPGRALAIQIPWHLDLSITILAVYAPNSPIDNRAFWQQISDNWDDLRIPPPDMVIGDFNIVEDAIDRLPAHSDDPDTVAELQSLKNHFGLTDGWRSVFQSTRKYSFIQEATGARSRIDRIYVTGQLSNSCTDWEIREPNLPTDHSVVSTTLVNRRSPYIGPGRWVLPTFLLADEEFLESVYDLGMELQKNFDTLDKGTRTEAENCQTLFADFKTRVKDYGQARAKEAIPKMVKKLKELRAKADLIEANESFTTSQELQVSAALLRKQITDLERKRYHKSRIGNAARHGIEGDALNKYWSGISKERKPRDMIHELRHQDPHNPGMTDGQVEKRSDKMANVMKDFFDGLQRAPFDTDETKRDETTKEVLDEIPEEIHQDVNMETLAAGTSRTEILKALDSTENGKAAGLDGIPYELYKVLNRKFVRDQRAKKRTPFDIIGALVRVFHDVEDHGCDHWQEEPFAQGWICPLYKKDDPRLPSNYRPITLLNTDYKIYTKSLAMKLASVAPELVHENQAGFIPGRNIFDHTKLSKMMINYAEATEENGAIIALDQEKAYDRISHDYLWKTLQRFGIPNRFINTVKSLYASACSVVVVNGEHSFSFKITRGVRQGDPLSCLLFDIAIEPLAIMLRNSNLHGFRIPGITDRLVTTLFADDTTVYMSEGDTIETLQEILQKWCLASGAKFNLNKTEVIPIGSVEHRERVTTTRKLGGESSSTMPADFKIAPDGKPVRILGCWIGNKVDQATPWTKKLEQIGKALQLWKRCSPTLKGKTLIVQMVIGGMTQYLTKVQGMPKSVELVLTKMMREFIWDDKRPPISLEQLQRPIEEGGIKLLDLVARNEAIELTWLKSFLDLTIKRPAWAGVADILIGLHITKASGNVHKLSQINVFLQSWRVNIFGKYGLPKDLQRMMRTAGKYNLTCNAIKLKKSLKKELPIWYHFGAKDHLKHLNNSPSGKCLRENHRVKAVGELPKIAKRLNPNVTPDHKTNRDCNCHDCYRDRTTNRCENPHRCALAAEKLLSQLHLKWDIRTEAPSDNLTLTSRRRSGNRLAIKENKAIVFNPASTLTTNLSRIFRVFAENDPPSTDPGYRPRLGATVLSESLTAHISGVIRNKKREEMRTACAVWFGRNHPLNAARRIRANGRPGADLCAVLLAAQIAPNFAPLKIISTSSYVVKTFTEWCLRWETKGWVGVKNKEIIRAILSRLRQRSAVTTFQWVKTDEIPPDYEEPLGFAQSALDLPEISEIDVTVNKKFNLTGMELAAATQALLYRGIREQTTLQKRRQSEQNVEKTQESILKLTGRRPSESWIWRSLRDKAIRRQVSDFLWKTLHGAHRIGEFWSHIPGLEDRGKCPVCNSLEDAEHILFRCRANGQNLVWRLAKATWSKTGQKWLGGELGALLGCRSIHFPIKKNKSDELSPSTTTRRKIKKKRPPGISSRNGTQRLFIIIMTEAAYLIWKLRNERRIKEADNTDFKHTTAEIENRWLKALNDRLMVDRAMVNWRRFGKGAMNPSVVLTTWQDVIQCDENLPTNWIRSERVLVGSVRPAPVAAPPGG